MMNINCHSGFLEDALALWAEGIFEGWELPDGSGRPAAIRIFSGEPAAAPPDPEEPEEVLSSSILIQVLGRDNGDKYDDASSVRITVDCYAPDLLDARRYVMALCEHLVLKLADRLSAVIPNMKLSANSVKWSFAEEQPGPFFRRGLFEMVFHHPKITGQHHSDWLKGGIQRE